MADNYLEEQYASYQARKAAWEKAKKYGNPKPIKKKTIAKATNEDKKDQ